MAKKLNSTIPGLLKERNGKDEVVRVKNIIGSASVEGEGLQSAKDRKSIKDYEAIQNFDIGQQKKVHDSIFQGIGTKNPYKPETMVFNETPEAEAAREILSNNQKKQAMVSEYNDAVNRQIEKALSDYKPQSDETIPMLAGTYANAALHPIKYEQAQQDIMPTLQQYGVNTDQLANYFAAQALREQNKQAQAYAEEHPVAGTMAAFPINQIAALQTGANAVKNMVEGVPLGENQALREYAQLAPTIRETVKQGIDENSDTDAIGNVRNTLYDALNAMGDMGYSFALSGATPKGMNALMSYNSAANALNSQMGKNTSDEQKIATAISNGLIEYATNMLPIEHLFKLANNPAGRQTIGQLFLGAMVQGGIEVPQELASNIGNAIADNLINGEQSDYAQSVQANIANGMSEEEAQKSAMIDIAKQAGYDAIVAFISAAGMGGIAGVANNANYDANNFAPGIDDVQAFAEYNASQQSGNERAGLPSVFTQQAQNLGAAQEQTENPWTLMREPTLAERIRNNIDPQYASDNLQVRNMVNEPAATVEQTQEQNTPQTNQQAQANVDLKPIENYNSKEIVGQKDLTRKLNKYVEMFGKENPAAQQKLSEVMRLLNRFVETYNKQDYYDAGKIWETLENDLRGVKFTNSKGSTYELKSDMFYEDFIDVVSELYQLAEHNVLGKELPLKPYNFKWDSLDTMVGTYGSKSNVNELGTLKGYLDAYLRTGDAQKLANAKVLIEKLEGDLKGKQYKRKSDKQILTYKDGKFTSAMNKIIKEIDEYRQEVERRKNKPATTQAEAQPVIPSVEQTETQLPQNTSNDVIEAQNDVIEQTAPEAQNAPASVPSVNNAPSNAPIAPSNNGNNNAPQPVLPWVGNSDRVSKFASNSEANNFAYMQNPVSQANLQADIEAGYYDKGRNATNKVDVYHNADVDAASADWRTNRAQELEARIANGDLTDTGAYRATMDLAEEAENNGDHDRQRYLATRLAGVATDAGRILYQLSREALFGKNRTGTTALAKLNQLVGAGIDRYFDKGRHAKQLANCNALAQQIYALRKGDPNTLNQSIRSAIDGIGESKLSKMDDTDVEYLARMVKNGMKATDIQYRLEQKLVTGNIDVSDADLDAVNKLLAEANNYDFNSKKAAELDAKACKILAEYLPEKTFAEKVRAWRYLAMLGNPRTHIRNFVGNFLYGQVLETISDKIAATMETIAEPIAKAAGKDFERTKTILPSSPAWIKAAGKYLNDHAYGILTDESSKYADMKRGIASEQKTFTGNNIIAKGAQGLLEANSAALGWGDTIYLEGKYKQAMAGYLRSHNADIDIFNSTDAKDIALLERASEYAIRKAKEATFHEDNLFATKWNQAMANLRQGGLAGQAVAMMGDATLPFVKTPSNITKDSILYSPLGIFDVANQIVRAKDPVKAIEAISKTITGSSLMLLGAFLGYRGHLRTKGNKDEKQLDKLTGEQDYSAKIGNKSVTLDWAAPAMIPVFLGAEAYKQFVEEGDKDFGLVATAMLDPLTEMSMLQGINNSIESISTYNNSDYSTTGQLVTDIFANLGMQAVPTLAGQIARSVDENRRNTYYTGENGTKDTVMRHAKKLANKIPGLSDMNEAQISAWGEEQKNTGDNFASRFFYNAILPAYVTDVSKDATEQELYRLNEGGAAKSILPSLAKSTPVNGKGKLTPQDYTVYAQIEGQNKKNLYDETINTSYYNSLDDEGKADLLNEVRLFSDALSMNEFTKVAQNYDYDYNIEENQKYKKSYQAYQYGGTQSLVDYMEASKMASELAKENGSSDARKIDKFTAVESLENASQEDKIAYLKIMGKYTIKGNYVEKFLGDKYAYDWFGIEAKAGDNKNDQIYAIYTSDLPSYEKQLLTEVAGMKDDEAKYQMRTNQ